MQRLVTTSQAARILGLSVQGIHYRIKKNRLKSKKEDGKLYVYIDDDIAKDEKKENSSNNKLRKDEDEHLKLLLKSKDEQIDLLKKSIKWMKTQHSNEIYRLEKNQKRVIKVFNQEIKLLQSAFNEMRAIYKPQLARKETKSKFIDIKDFFVLLKRYGKNSKEIKLIIINCIKNGDKRFIYNKNEKTILILNDDFLDLK